MNQTSMSQKGQVVIPAEIREKLKLKPSTKFEVKSVGDTVVFTPVVKDEDAFGMFTPKEKITEEKIDKAISEGVKKRFNLS